MSILSDIKKIEKQLEFPITPIPDVKKKNILWEKGDSQLIKSVLNSKLSEKLSLIGSKYTYITEAFVFNHQGALLASQKLTSDFDQSDEEKFTLVKEYDDFTIRNITNIYFDESSNSFQVGIYIRLEDSKGEFAGGVFIGADINKLITYYKLN